MLELLFELLGEFVLQVVGEVLVEFGFRSLGAPFRKDSNSWFAAVGYALFGAAAGGLSLWMFPHHFTPPGTLRLLNLLFTPVAVGLCMSALGAWRARRGQPLLRIDRFLFGYVFAVALAAVRYAFAA